MYKPRKHVALIILLKWAYWKL